MNNRVAHVKNPGRTAYWGGGVENGRLLAVWLFKELSFWAGIPGDRCEAVLRLSERKVNYDDLK